MAQMDFHMYFNLAVEAPNSLPSWENGQPRPRAQQTIVVQEAEPRMRVSGSQPEPHPQSQQGERFRHLRARHRLRPHHVQTADPGLVE